MQRVQVGVKGDRGTKRTPSMNQSSSCKNNWAQKKHCWCRSGKGESVLGKLWSFSFHCRGFNFACVVHVSVHVYTLFASTYFNNPLSSLQWYYSGRPSPPQKIPRAFSLLLAGRLENSEPLFSSAGVESINLSLFILQKLPIFTSGHSQSLRLNTQTVHACLLSVGLLANCCAVKRYCPQ